ncbi:hypothetical protein [Sphingomonas sp. LT1P40]|uniref:hypothetical protein n=1 Tax=Alteristakelama amylovorans TaxID=3096166 RepID=UPI002FC74A01
MSLNEFILAFIGVIIGLGVADLLTSFHKLLRAGSRVKWDWLTLFYAVLMLYSMIVFWWWQFGYPGAGRTLTTADFLPKFVFLAISFLMVAAALPDDLPEEGVIDMRAFYLASLRHRWGLTAASLIMSSGTSAYYIVGAARWDRLPGQALVLGSVILALLATRIRSIWFQVLAIGWIFGVTSWFNMFRPIGP